MGTFNRIFDNSAVAILGFVAVNPGISQTVISRNVNYTSYAHITHVVRELERVGLLEVTREERDRRNVYCTLTKKGMKINKLVQCIKKLLGE